MSKRITLKTEILLEGLKFPESPRWHDDKLWFVDIDGHKVMTVDLSGNTETILERNDQVSGLGWLPDNRLLVVSMGDNKLLRLDPEGVKVVADLNKFNTVLCNDMVIAYTCGTQWGRKSRRGNMAFPNGTFITPDDKTLIIAETFATKLTAFDIMDDGSLTGRRVWANLKSLAPDGICLDAEGGIWIAAPGRGRVARVLEGGQITHIVRVENDAYACMLGGPDRKTLFVATSKHTRDAGKIEFVNVDIPGAGIP